jgi:MoaA/NifB/PqqE/SkfB family radical SAM enzyme
MSFESFKANTTRAAVSKTLDGIIKYVNKDRQAHLTKLIDMSEKLIGYRVSPGVFSAARNFVNDPDCKWMQYTNKLLDEIDPNVVKMHALNLGYQAGFYGVSKTHEMAKKYGVNIPWVMLLDPTSACNMHCTGCWAAEYGHKLNLSYEDLDSIITQGEKLGIYFYLFTGGEPLVRRDDLIRLAEKHNKCAFHAFTNGTLVDDAFCREMKRVGNFSLSLSVEGFEDVNDLRRGTGSFEKVMHAMDLLRENKLLFGTSICYTSKNYKTVTSDEFLDLLIEKGVRYSWYFHYMPVGNEAATELLLTPEQRVYMYHRVREVRAAKGGKPIFLIDFQNDGEYVSGCIAGGKYYCHINPNGDVEPCVFIHYSGANIHDKTLLECLQQPLFKAYQDAQPFNDNPLRPCPMLENPECLQEIVKKSGAVSTDLQSPEAADHLCGKCINYAKDWAPVADQLIEEHPPKKKIKKGHSSYYGPIEK